jgi:hypothetical protein
VIGIGTLSPESHDLPLNCLFIDFAKQAVAANPSCEKVDGVFAM